MKNLRKVRLSRNLGWACDYQKILQKSYEKLRTKLWKTYDDSKVSYKNVKFTASDVIRETLCQRRSLVEYFELKITDNQSDYFLRMFFKNDLPFSEESHRKSYLVDLQKTYENLTPNLGKILRSFKNQAARYRNSKSATAECV